MKSKNASLQLILTLSKSKANVQELDSFALTTTDLAVYHWLPVFSPFLLVASGCLDEKLLIIEHILMDQPSVNDSICYIRPSRPQT